MKPFNQNIINSLKSYGEEPDHEVWEGLKKDLKKEEKRKRLGVFFVVLCFLILSGSATLMILQNEPATEALSTPTIAKVSSNSSSDASNSMNAVNAEKTYEKTQSGQGSLSNKTSIPHERTGKTYPLKSPVSPYLPETALVLDNDNQHIFVNEETTVETTLRLSKLKKFNISQMTLPELQKVPLKIKRSNRSYFVGCMLMPVISHRILTGDKSLISLRNQSETPQNGFALGILSGKRLNSFLDISVGVHFTSYTQNILHGWNETLINNDSVLVRKRNTGEVFYHHFSDSTRKHQTQSYTNRFSIIQIPVSFNFHKSISARMSIYTSAGVQLNYILRSQVNVNYQATSGLSIEKTPHQSAYSRFGAGLHAGIGLSGKLANHYELSGGLHANISSNYFIKGPIKEYPYIIGLQLGIRKYF